MADPLREPGFLTSHQLRAVRASGDVFLTACPGSGKTRAAGTRVARLMEEHRAVAACSYTNVGVDQIRHVLSRDLGRVPDERHFIGTLHGFLLRYVLYPFGHLVTGSSGSPRLVGDDTVADAVIFDNDPRIRLSLSRFRFRPDGSLIVRSTPARFRLSPADATRKGQRQALMQKKRVARAGIVTFDDAMYWSLRVLESRTDVASAVAGRFEELLVDEAQDTSELQLACLHALCATGRLKSLFLIGDLEQSISAFTGASRVGCERLAADRGLADMAFEENHRASQRLCDVAVHFCARTSPDRAVGPDRHCDIAPQLFIYPARAPTEAVTRFRELLEELGESPASAAVLARNNKLVDELNGDSAAVEVRPRPFAIGRAVSALRGGGTIGRRQLEAVDGVVSFAAWGESNLSMLDPSARWKARSATMELLRLAPDLDLDLREFIRGCASALGTVVDGLVETPHRKAGVVVASAASQEGHRARDVFRPGYRDLRAQTVHDIKGESRPSVLVVVDRLRSRTHGAQSTLWSRALRGQAVTEEEAEELRIAFVALTRARRLCLVALPDDSDSGVIDAFDDAGFERC